MDDSSSDSDAGERLKNLKLTLAKSHSQDIDTDEKYVHKRKLGDLIFDANFETGNLCRVERINSFEYELMVRPDLANPSCHSWFNFSISNQQVNQCVIFTFVNLNSRGLSLLQQGLTPVVRSKSAPNWVRLHKDQVFYYGGCKGTGNSVGMVLSIAFRFKSMEDKHQFALFYPYSHSTLVHFLGRWEIELKRRRRGGGGGGGGKLNKPPPEFGITDIGSSFTFRSIQIIEIGSLAPIDKRPLVIVVCRRCGNMDSNVSLVCQGMMDLLLGDSRVGAAARKLIKFAFLPMLEPDSICSGNSESDLLGQTSLSDALLYTNQAVYANMIQFRKLLESWYKSNSQVVLLELGVNLNLIGCRLLGSYYGSSFRMEKHLSIARLMSLFVPGFQLENCSFRKERPTFKSLFNSSSSWPNVNHYLFEISPFAYYQRSLSSRLRIERVVHGEYDQVKYISVGVALVHSLLDSLMSAEKSGNKAAWQQLDASTRNYLNSFHLDNKDIDDLLLIRQTLRPPRKG